VTRISDTFAGSQIPFFDMAANQVALAEKISEQLSPSFSELGLSLNSFAVENLSLPDELQKALDQRISMNVIGDMGRYTQYQVAQSIPLAAANEGGGAAGLGAGLGVGMAMAQTLAGSIKSSSIPDAPPAPSGTDTGTKFCLNCGKPISRVSKFCPECGHAQQ
jgi:membrane protease subunit (stomatin/prohibitin family)